MDSEVITVATGSRPEVRDITAEAQAFVDAHANGGDGLLHVFVPHATAGIAIIEVGAGSDDERMIARGRTRLGQQPAEDHRRT